MDTNSKSKINPDVYLVNESQLKKYIQSKTDEILRDMSYSYDILRNAINMNTKVIGLETFDELNRKYVNSELNDVLESMDKNYQILKIIYDLQKISN